MALQTARPAMPSEDKRWKLVSGTMRRNGYAGHALIETLRKGANPLDDRMLMVAKAHLAALTALHAKDVRGEGGNAGVAVMAKLASIHA